MFDELWFEAMKMEIINKEIEVLKTVKKVKEVLKK